MTAGKIHDLRHFGFSDLKAEHADHGQPLFVHRQHQFKRLSVVHPEKSLKHMHDEFHRRVVIIQQHDLVQRRFGCLRLGLRQKTGLAITIAISRLVGHHMKLERRHLCLYPSLGGSVAQYKRKLALEKGALLLNTICFDADDTLWQNERFFKLNQDRFAQLLSDVAEPAHLAENLLAAERRNIEHYGYGVKGFTLSMIETALQMTDNRVSGQIIAEIIAIGREMHNHPVELLPGAKDAIQTLSSDFQLLLITKGDLFHQERKLAQSGLGELFDGVEIVSEKHAELYRDIFSGRGIIPATAAMVGNSLKSDVNPAIEAGGWGVYVPSDLTWELEVADAPSRHPRYRKIRSLAALPKLVETICRNI